MGPILSLDLPRPEMETQVTSNLFLNIDSIYYFLSVLWYAYMWSSGLEVDLLVPPEYDSFTMNLTLDPLLRFSTVSSF